MEPKIIESMVASIPPSEMGEVQTDDEIWEETDGGAHFKVTRHWVYLPEGRHQIVALTVSGQPMERRRIIQEFVEVFGAKANGRDIDLNDETAIDTILWVVNE